MYIRSKGNFYKMGHKDTEISNLIYCFLRGTLVEEKQKELTDEILKTAIKASRRSPEERSKTN